MLMMCACAEPDVGSGSNSSFVANTTMIVCFAMESCDGPDIAKLNHGWLDASAGCISIEECWRVHDFIAVFSQLWIGMSALAPQWLRGATQVACMPTVFNCEHLQVLKVRYLGRASLSVYVNPHQFVHGDTIFWASPCEGYCTLGLWVSVRM
jgi:hypothetical protein